MYDFRFRFQILQNETVVAGFSLEEDATHMLGYLRTSYPFAEFDLIDTREY